MDLNTYKDNRLIRLVDIVFASLGLVVLIPVLILVIFFVYLEDGSPIFLQQRVGKNQKPFTLFKIRTMRIGTVSRPSHITDISELTRLGLWLRRTKVDELPQLLNVLAGSMSIVGPRPCLLSQENLIAARDRRGVFSVRPGLTGLSQIQNIDMSDIELLAETDEQLIKTLNFVVYFKIIFLTFLMLVKMLGPEK